jgi:hypothetical protein
MTDNAIVGTNESVQADISAPLPSLSLVSIPTQTQGLLLRMFADPRVLAKNESADLVAQLRECVAQQPDVADLRVLLGMALCVNLDAQAAMEELGEAVSLAPESFIAHLKMGELWMRLRVMPKAEDHTRHAALLAQNLAQSELARRQAATIRTMMREGIERGGYSRTPWFSLARVRWFWKRHRAKTNALVTVDAS